MGIVAYTEFNVNANKHNPLRAGCYIKLSREIILKRAVIHVQTADNAGFAWSVVIALHPAQGNIHRKSSYPHYMSILNLGGNRISNNVDSN